MGGDANHRDDPTWVVLELSRAGEQRLEEGTFDAWVRKALNAESTHPVFVPSVTYPLGGRLVTVHLMEGYAFVGTGCAENTYFRLEDTAYVRKVLSVRTPRGMRALNVLPDVEVQKLREQLREQVSSDVDAGLRVKVLDGPYTNLEGVVIEVDAEFAHVQVDLRSLSLIARLPKMFLIPTEESP